MNTFTFGQFSSSFMVIGLCGLLLAGCVADKQLPEAPSELAWPAESWPVSTAVAEGIDQAALDSLVADIENGDYGLVDHFLLIRHGRIVADHHFTHDYAAIAEEYDQTNHQYNYDHPDWHPFYNGTKLHSLQSVTKSVTSAAVGIAIDEGLIDGVEAPVMPYFEDYTIDLTDPRKSAITLEDFLTMRSGIKWESAGAYGTGLHSTDHLEASEQWIQFVLDQPMDEEPGEVFEYNDGVSVLIGKILREATGQRADEWTSERLFQPLGIKDYYWKITPDGEADTEGGLYLSTHDLARIGLLFLRGGDWDGRQIVSEEWVRVSTSPVIADIFPQNERTDPGYGYQWWIMEHDGQRPQIFAARGYGGQFLLVAPEYDIVVVFNGWDIHGGAARSTERALRERILPAIRK